MYAVSVPNTLTNPLSPALSYLESLSRRIFSPNTPKAVYDQLINQLSQLHYPQAYPESSLWVKWAGSPRRQSGEPLAENESSC